MIRILAVLALFGATATANNHELDSSIHFEQALRSRFYVDKSLLIKYLLETLPKISKEKMLVIKAPPGFGKSSNLDMFRKFLEKQVNEDGTFQERFTSKNYKLFADRKLNIFKDEPFFQKHFAQYPVIYLDLNKISASAQYAKTFLTNIISTLKNEHSHLPVSWLPPDSLHHKTSDLKKCFKFFLQDFFQFFNQTGIVLIDVNEPPVLRRVLREGFRSSDDLLKIDAFMKNFFYKELSENENVGRVIVFSSVTGEGIHNPNSPSKNIKHLSVFEDEGLIKYFGFTETEICNRFSDNYNKVEIDKCKQLCYWYGGYRGRNTTRQVFSFTSFSSYQDTEFLPKRNKNRLVLRSFLRMPSNFLDLKIVFGSKFLGPFVEEATESKHPIVMTESLDFKSVQNLVLNSDLIKQDGNHRKAKEIIQQYLTELGFFTANYDYNEKLRARWGTKLKSDKIVTITAPNYETIVELTNGFIKHGYYTDKYNASKETVDSYIRAVQHLNNRKKLYWEFGTAVAKIFCFKKPKNEAELVGALHAFALQSGVFKNIRRGLVIEARSRIIHLLIARYFKRLIFFHFAFNGPSSEQILSKATDEIAQSLITNSGMWLSPVDEKAFEEAITIGFSLTSTGYWSLSRKLRNDTVTINSNYDGPLF